MPPLNRQGKMGDYINWVMRITLADSRQMQGTMMAFDKHMNLVLDDAQEFRVIKKSGGKGAGGVSIGLTESEEKRALGLVIVRGSTIHSVTPVSGPQGDASSRLKGPSFGAPSSMSSGPGVARGAGRGAPPALSGPPMGVGGGGFGAPPGMSFGGRGGPPQPGQPPFGYPPGGPPGPPGSVPPGFGPPPGFGAGRGFSGAPPQGPPGGPQGGKPPGFGGR